MTVFAAASTKDVVESLAVAFERTSHVQVRVSPGSSNQLAAQIIAGAPADVFISASSEWADKLRDSNLVESQSRFLSNRLVLVTPRRAASSIRYPADMVPIDRARVSLAGENVPAGRYAEQALRSLELFDSLASAGRIVRGGDVRMALSYVELGEADAGVVYATDARASSHVEAVYVFDESLHDPIRYPIILLKSAEKNEAAQKLYEFLVSDEAKRSFAAAGFTIVDGQ